MQDLGEQTASIALDGAKELMEATGNMLKYLFSSVLTKDYDKEIKKQQLKDIKERQYSNDIGSRAGYIRAKQMQKSNHEITYMTYAMKKEQLKEFQFHAKQRGVTVSWIQNGHEKDTYLAMCYTKDVAIIEDITAQLVRNNKLQTIDKAIDSQIGYKKVDFENSVENLIKNKNISSPIILCDKENPNNYIKVKSNIDKFEGREFLNTNFDVYSNGKKQKCSEFKHGEFTHYSDFKGNNSTSHGNEHWDNMKAEMSNKANLKGEVLYFTSEEKYKQYKDDFELHKGKLKTGEKLYNELVSEKEKIIRKDINDYNAKQSNALFSEMCEEKKEQSLSFNDTVDRFQCEGWSKEEPYYICKRTDPDNYMVVTSELDKYNGNEYTKHNYEIFVDDKKVLNSSREDGKWTDERFDNRPQGFWKNTKENMKIAGEFTDDLVVFYSEKEMLKYREAYLKEVAIHKNVTPIYEHDNESFKDFSGVINNLKEQLNRYDDIGTYENGTFVIKTDDNLTKLPNLKDSRVVEATIISKQIYNFEKMNYLANEIASSELQLKVNSQSEHTGSDFYLEMQDKLKDKVDNLKEEYKQHESTQQQLELNRKQIIGANQEANVSDRGHEFTHGEEANGRITMRELKEQISTKSQQMPSVSIEKTFQKTKDTRGDR